LPRSAAFAVPRRERPFGCSTLCVHVDGHVGGQGDKLTSVRCWGLWPILFLLLAMATSSRAELASLRGFGPAEGLQSMTVRMAVQDAEGFVWVATENGLYRFDGMRFRRVGAEQGLSWINTLAPQADGLWIGTPDGLWWLRRGKLVSIPAPDGRPLAVFGPGALAPGHDDTLWVAARGGLHQVRPEPDGSGWRVARAAGAQPELRKIDGLLAMPGGALWFGCARALCRMIGGLVERFDPVRGVPPARWDWLTLGSDGSVWARGGRHLLQLAAGAERFVERGGAGFEADEAGFYPLAEDAQRRIVTATRGALLRWDGLRWERFDAASGLTFPGRMRPWFPTAKAGCGWVPWGAACCTGGATASGKTGQRRTACRPTRSGASCVRGRPTRSRSMPGPARAWRCWTRRRAGSGRWRRTHRGRWTSGRWRSIRRTRSGRAPGAAR
jgi:ligand-binding sensor domain-containing protein